MPGWHGPKLIILTTGAFKTHHTLYFTFWKFGTAGAHGRSHPHFKVPKGMAVNSSMHVHVEHMLKGWPRTLIYMHGCNKPGWHGPKLVDYKTKASKGHIKVSKSGK